MTRGVFTLLLVVCVTATITEGYGSYRHGGHVGHTGLYKNHLNSYKDLLTGYGNDHVADHIYHSGHFHKIVVGRLYRRFHQFGIDLIGNGLRYKNYYFARKCEPLKLYNAFSSCFNEYGRIGDCFPGLIKSGLIGHQHHYQKYGRSYGLGVKFVRRGIIYHETVYHYHVRSLEFIWTMTSCYNAFHHASICVPKLQKQGLIGAPHPLTGHVGRSIGYHGFKIVHGRFSYHGHVYKLSCSTTRFYSVWNKCYNHYHSVGRCFGYLQQKHLFVSYSSTSIGYHGYDQLGFKIVHGGFSYHGKAYSLKCSESRFYKVWDDCYGHYHKGSVCFDRLFKQGLFGYNVHSDYAHGDIDYLGYYNSHHGFHLVDGGFTYKDVAYKLSCNTDRFYRSWHDCYDSYHSVDVCFGRLYKSHLFVSLDHGDVHTVHTNYHGYKYLGFRVNHRRFTYHGKAYRLKCSTRRFYGLWDDCYNHYHSRSLCFNKIYKQHFFGYYHGASSIVHGGNYVDDFGYYKAHHGFSIVNGGFSYNGAAYKLSCSRTRFYKAWRSCYGTYHSVDVCYGRLLNDHLFVALEHGDNYSVHTNYHGYKYLGFKLHHRRFSYHGKAYRLKCSTRRFYSLWDDCYNHYHSRSLCFNKIYKQHFFGYYHGSSSIVHGSDYIDDFGYYKAHHGFTIVNGGFSYNGAAYKLSCSTTRFYKAWRSCYGTYHSVDVCYGRLLNDHLFVALGGGHGYTNYHGYKYLGFRIRHRRFSYLGKAYRLRCGRRRFYRLWDDCYNTYHDRSVCFNTLYKRHIFGYGHAHFHGYKYLGFRIRHRRFSYLGKAYRLKCGRRRFYRLWDSCYNHYHDRSVCFGNLFKRHIFDYYGDYAHAHIGASYRGDYGYYKTHHGFSIIGGNFLYKGAGFKLSCSKARFYSAWNSCYRSYHNIDRCFGTLFNAHLFIKAGPDYDYSFLRKNLYLHRKIAAHHVNRIHAVANSHVGKINLVAHTHTRHINHVANTHVNRITSEANSHIKRFLKIANNHLYRLQKHSKIHLHSLEEQHKRHLLEREHQHKTHVVNKEISNRKHEHAIAAAHHYAYAKGGVYAPAGTVIKTVSHGSYGGYK
ncbi:Hypothetical predicted protein [Mytilus galloprovincialis]|uniref:Uncharacterized protein n=1 Tax=Mytilus galloprovincialis TaxID=29158 RepID=A0A8B6DZF6_MYTGA|nr:Hypothetical predicted protein [Mytilus galloprovincialis]